MLQLIRMEMLQMFFQFLSDTYCVQVTYTCTCLCNDISIELEIQWNFVMLSLLTYLANHNKILHMSWQ